MASYETETADAAPIFEQIKGVSEEVSVAAIELAEARQAASQSQQRLRDAEERFAASSGTLQKLIAEHRAMPLSGFTVGTLTLRS